MEIIFYTTHCPKCKILESKLKEKNISFTYNDDVDEMRKLKMLSAPGLMIDGKLLNFAKAVEWVNAQEAK